ncbi:hypothetical protein EX87_11815 [Brevibacillus laterosporus]|uniref:Uncharacterized protein n=1 Tax=Brevibacillus laterosporus TaxID=1465 RepID=A0A0F7EGH9_BRELA|nr:hypothetical protein EX87_11815 [Brevibacillus laterosporus]
MLLCGQKKGFLLAIVERTGRFLDCWGKIVVHLIKREKGANYSSWHPLFIESRRDDFVHGPFDSLFI